MVYRFGAFELDTIGFQLRADGQQIAVEPQVFDLLVYLIEHRDRVVTKDELFKKIWNGRAVSEAALSSRIRAARQAIGDDGERQELIQTVYGRGVRFIGAIDDITVPAGEVTTVATRSSLGAWMQWTPQLTELVAQNRGVVFAVAIAIAALMATAILWRMLPAKERLGLAANTIAVLPFTDMSEDKDQEYFADGVSEELLNALVKVGGLKVVGRTSSFSFKGKRVDLKTIGQALNVSNILEGSIRRQGERLRITVQLVQVEDGYHLWSETYDRNMTDIFKIQNDIARSVVEALQGILNYEGEGSITSVSEQTMDPETYRLYLQARWFLRNRNADRLARALALFKEVIAREPKYALAYSGLTAAEILYDSYQRGNTLSDLVEARQRAAGWSEQALSLDPTLGEPRAALAFSYGKEWQWARARRLFEEALRVDPSDTSTRYWYGSFLHVTGHLQDGLDQFEAAIARDPVFSHLMGMRAYSLYALGREKEATEAAQVALALGYNTCHFLLGHIARYNGDIDQAVTHYMAYWQSRYQSSERIEARRRLYATMYGSNASRETFFRELEQQLADRYLSKAGAVMTYREAGYYGHAMKLYAERVSRSNGFLAGSWRPENKAMRQHPDFPTFAKRLGLMDYWREFGFPDQCRPKGIDGIACE